MMKTSKLFMTLPEAYACTPDGMEIDRYGNLILSCPNYADEHMSGCVLRITLQEIWGSLLTVIGIYICVIIRDGQNDLSFFIREEF